MGTDISVVIAVEWGMGRDGGKVRWINGNELRLGVLNL